MKIQRELKEAGLSITIEAMKGLEELGFYKLQKIARGKRFLYVASRKEAEKIKRLLWAYYYGNETYTDDI